MASGSARISPVLPVRLPYEVEALASISALVYIWTMPTFQHALGREVEERPDVPVQLLVRQLHITGARAPSLLAGDLGMTRSNVSKIVGRAAERGLVDRLRDDDDARSVLVRLTEAGRHLAKKTLAVGDRMMRQMTKDWSSDELAALARLTGRLAVATSAYAEQLLTADSHPEQRLAGPPLPERDSYRSSR